MILTASGNENLWYKFYFVCYFLITPTFRICVRKRPELVRLQLGHQADAASRSVEPSQKTRDSVKRTLIFTNDDQINAELNSNGESSVSSFTADESSSNPTMPHHELEGRSVSSYGDESNSEMESTPLKTSFSNTFKGILFTFKTWFEAIFLKITNVCVRAGYNNEESNSQADMFAMSPSPPPNKGATKDPKRKNETNQHKQPPPPMPAAVYLMKMSFYKNYYSQFPFTF